MPKQHQPVMEFRSVLLHCDLVDFGFQGNIFIWNNRRPGDAFVQERLDRACATSKWSELFPHAKVTHIQSSYSDHNPIFITLSQPNQIGRMNKIPTRFEEKWAYHPDCEGVIRGAWATENVVGNPMFRLFEKIKKCRFELVQWSRNIFGNFKTQLQARQSALKDFSMQNHPKILQEIKTLKHEINTVLNQDEIFWRQRSRSIWLQAGDKNTKFFHQRASHHRRKNHIFGITSQSREWCTSDEHIAETAEQ